MRRGPCGRDAHAGDSRCLLHTDAPKDDARVRAEVIALVEASEARGEAVDLAGVVVRDLDVSTSTFETAVSFRGARFLGRTSFAGCVFRFEADYAGASTEGGADDHVLFTEVEFHGPADFSGARFATAANFVDARFGAIARFSEAEFAGECTFRGARMGEPHGLVSFRHARWRRGASFNRARFHGEASFADVAFEGEDRWADFTGAAFDGPASFVRARFEGVALFSYAEFREAAVFRRVKAPGFLRFRDASFTRGALFEDLDLAPGGRFAAHALRMDFTRVAVREEDGVRFVATGDRELDLSGVRWAFSDTAKMRFENVRWPRAPGGPRALPGSLVGRNAEPGLRILDERHLYRPGAAAPPEPAPAMASWEDPDFDAAETVLAGRDEVTHEHLAVAYKGLRRAYERSLRYFEAGEFHVREMEMRRLAPRGGAWRSRLARNVSFLNAYRILSRYGESYRRAGVWLVLVALVFLAVRLDAGEAPGRAAWSTLLGFFALQLKTGADLDVAQALVGLPLVAFFVMALRRHFKR